MVCKKHVNDGNTNIIKHNYLKECAIIVQAETQVPELQCKLYSAGKDRRMIEVSEKGPACTEEAGMNHSVWVVMRSLH